MIRLYEYIYNNIQDHIFESAGGVALNKSNNLQNFVLFLEKYIKRPSILIDSSNLLDEFPELKEYVTVNVKEALFYLKQNKQLCMYEPVVKNMTADELSKFEITVENEKYHLPNIRSLLEATSKRINSANDAIKIWPQAWNKHIIRGEAYKNEGCLIDFKNLGAFEITEQMFDNFASDIAKMLEEYDKELANVLYADNPFEYLKNNTNNTKIKNSIANVLSEPLAICSVLPKYNKTTHIFDKIVETVTDDNIAIESIVIPIKQNWPVADFYIKLKNVSGRLLAVSVKSNGAGNSSTILSCLFADKTDNKTHIHISDNDKNALVEFFDTIISIIGKGGKQEFKLSDELQNKLTNISEYALQSLENNCEEKKINNVKKLCNTYKDILDLIKDTNNELYNSLIPVYEYKGTNFIEKILVTLFNCSDKVLNRITTSVGNATSCWKITVNTNGTLKCLQQKPTGKLRLIAKQGGQGLNINVENNKITNISLGHKTSQGQWLGYSF